MRRLLLATLLVSAAAIGYEILLMRVLSIVQWHHFAYMIISLALLGYGASGTFIALSRSYLEPRFKTAFATSALLFSIAMIVCFIVAQRVPFNALEIVWDRGQFLNLTIVYLVFFVPFVFFFAKGYIQRQEWPKYALMFVLGGMQGLLGWYMVKSGLVDVPHVSQYRLTAHLVAAFIIYAYMFWVAISLLFPRPRDASSHSWYGKTLALFMVISVTVVSGGFVAGLKAGKIYNTFPMMGDH